MEPGFVPRFDGYQQVQSHVDINPLARMPLERPPLLIAPRLRALLAWLRLHLQVLPRMAPSGGWTLMAFVAGCTLSCLALGYVGLVVFALSRH